MSVPTTDEDPASTATSRIPVGIAVSKAAASLGSQIQTSLGAAGIDAWLATELDHPQWAQTEILVSIGAPCGAAELAAAPKLRAVVSPLLGYEWIDVRECTRRGVAVVNGEVPENRDGMAEATIMLILALLYRLRDAESALRADDRNGLAHGRLLRGKTVGIIGSGGISRAVIRRLEPWGCSLLVNSRSGAAPPGALLSPLDDLITASDVLVVATSLNAHTHHLLDRERLGKMKPTAVLVNTARGAIIDEGALVEVLRDGRISGAALDVFEVEPLAHDHPFRSLPNLILTPHAIGHTVEASVAVPVKTVENVLTLASGKLPTSCKNPEITWEWSSRCSRPHRR